jgi:hypothetical protein
LLRAGKIADFAVVLVYDDECISRYDVAHRVAHKDILGKSQSLIEKEWHENLPRSEVFKSDRRLYTKLQIVSPLLHQTLKMWLLTLGWLSADFEKQPRRNTGSSQSSLRPRRSPLERRDLGLKAGKSFPLWTIMW